MDGELMRINANGVLTIPAKFRTAGFDVNHYVNVALEEDGSLKITPIEAIRDLNDRLFPFGIFKLLYRLKRKKIRSARLMLLGVKKEYRGGVLGGLSVLFYAEKHRRSAELGHWGGELSWTLEDNEKINTGIEFMGGENYKTYRIYEKEL